MSFDPLEQPAFPPDAPSLRAAVGELDALLTTGGAVAAEIMEGNSPQFFCAGRLMPLPTIPVETVFFEIGSVTKIFTGLLLAIAVREKQVTLDHHLSRFLPFAVKSGSHVPEITLRQLATHTFGLPRMPDNYSFSPLDGPVGYTFAQLRIYLENESLDRKPPQPAMYSNLGFGLLGWVLETVLDKPFGVLLIDRITRPLGLRDLKITLEPADEARAARPHFRGALMPRRGPRGVLAGAGALFSTAADLLRFAQKMMDQDHALSEAWKLASTPSPFGSLVGRQIGLGVLILARKDGPVYWHNGATLGFRSHFEFSPARRSARVVLVNDQQLEIERILRSLSPRD